MSRHLLVSVPDGVPGLVGPVGLAEQGILLNAVRIHVKRVGMAPVVKRVQEHSDLVIIVNQFPAQHAGADLLRLRVKSQEYHVKVLVCVSQVSFRALGAGSAILGIVLGKFVHLEHLLGQRRDRYHALVFRKLGTGFQLGDLRKFDFGGRGRRIALWQLLGRRERRRNEDQES